MSVTRDLIRTFTNASFDQIPQPAIEITKQAILDDVGIGLLGYSMAGEPIIDYAKTVGGGVSESTLIGDGTKVSSLVAAGANAQMAFDTDFNETGPGHHIMSPAARVPDTFRPPLRSQPAACSVSTTTSSTMRSVWPGS